MDKEEKIAKIINNYWVNKADDESGNLRDLREIKRFIDSPKYKLEFNQTNHKDIRTYIKAKENKNIISKLESKLSNSTLVDLGAGGDSIVYSTQWFVDDFNVKKYIGIDVGDYVQEFIDEGFQKLFSDMDVNAQLIQEDYLKVISEMSKGDYNFLFLSPPYMIHKALSESEAKGQDYWKEFYKNIGRLTPKGNILVTDDIIRTSDLYKEYSGINSKYPSEIEKNGFSLLQGWDLRSMLWIKEK